MAVVVPVKYLLTQVDKSLQCAIIKTDVRARVRHQFYIAFEHSRRTHATSESLIRKMKGAIPEVKNNLKSLAQWFVWESSGTSDTWERPKAAVKGNWFLMKCVLVFRHMHKPDADVSYFEAVLYTSLCTHSH